MFDIVVVLKFFVRVFVSVLELNNFRKKRAFKYNAKDDEVCIKNDHAEAQPRQSKSEELIRNHCRGLLESKQRYIHQRLCCSIPPAVPCLGDENNNHPNGILQIYQNTIRTLKVSEQNDER